MRVRRVVSAREEVRLLGVHVGGAHPEAQAQQESSEGGLGLVDGPGVELRVDPGLQTPIRLGDAVECQALELGEQCVLRGEVGVDGADRAVEIVGHALHGEAIDAVLADDVHRRPQVLLAARQAGASPTVDDLNHVQSLNVVQSGVKGECDGRHTWPVPGERGYVATMTGYEWLDVFADHLGIERPEAAEIETLLDLAGVAAHSSERLAAPIACWLIGRAGLDPEDALNLARDLKPRPERPDR